MYNNEEDPLPPRHHGLPVRFLIPYPSLEVKGV